MATCESYSLFTKTFLAFFHNFFVQKKLIYCHKKHLTSSHLWEKNAFCGEKRRYKNNVTKSHFLATSSNAKTEKLWIRNFLQRQKSMQQNPLHKTNNNKVVWSICRKNSRRNIFKIRVFSFTKIYLKLEFFLLHVIFLLQ